MPQKIYNYNEKTEHDLLVELVIQGNSTLDHLGKIETHLSTINGTQEKHEARIDKLDFQMRGITTPSWLNSKAKVAGISTGAISIATILAATVCEILKTL